jgi:hypothetical protein
LLELIISKAGAMKKLLLFIFILISLYTCSVAQTVFWGKAVPGNIKDICTDDSGYVYATGLFGGTQNFDGFPLVAGSSGEIFILKYDSSGTIKWAKQSTLNGTYTSFLGITVDKAGNVYVAGDYLNIVRFDTITLTAVSNGYDDCFLVKYDKDGNAQWARKMGGIYYDEATSVITDSSLNVYVCGQFESGSIGTIGAYPINPGGFVAKYDSSGNVMWARNVNSQVAYKVLLDKDDNVYVSGIGYSPNYPIMLGKYSFAGNFIWNKSSSVGGTFNLPTDMCRMSNSDFLLSGSFHDTLKFGSFTMISDSDILGRSPDGYIFRVDTSGTVLSSKHIHSCGNDRSNDITANPFGVAVTGVYGYDANSHSPCQLNLGDGVILPGANYYNYPYIAFLDNNMNTVSAMNTNCASSGSGFCISSDESGGIYAGGNGHFCNGSLNLNGINYLVKFSGVTTTSVDHNFSPIGLTIYPNPAHNTFTISIDGQSSMVNGSTGSPTGQLKIYDVTGRMVHEQTIRNQESEIRNLNLSPGVYLVRVEMGEKVRQQKLVVE